MAGQKPSSQTGCAPTRRRCENSVICTAAKWGNGRTTRPKIPTCHFDDESGQCCDFAVHRRCKNSFPSTPRFTTISTRNAISSIVKLTRPGARPRSPSGSPLPPEVNHFCPSCANRRRVAIRLTAPLRKMLAEKSLHGGKATAAHEVRKTRPIQSPKLKCVINCSVRATRTLLDSPLSAYRVSHEHE